ncbi:unnamed protein product [Rotaria magnacalcarata]|uniref:Uncharacterized protein n=2 Tax=Rotaria magnacalcarata TaxID=392030 RepID=A0A814XW90_9BILA|nr:unnamed protein product [Rotaria magnacalcarata]CAF1483814.1 unnamed protein product [Rotaria magnacalcarata]CAF1903872.1 unnamed protein product [Rotaria magnacalcarata]CAF3929537.1 unnamed protein product [Rotaria magnacalcarata]
MVTLLSIQVFSIVATALTNLIGILAFATDYWSTAAYDLGKLRSHIKWIAVGDTTNDYIHAINITDDQNQTQALSFNDQQLSSLAMGVNNNTILYKTHKGIFRQCNYLSQTIRQRLKISKCRVLKVANNHYDDVTHGMNNPGRELIRLHNVAAACAILIVLLLCACTLIGVTVGILNGVVLATMTIGIIYLVTSMFSICLLAIMYTVLKSERKQSHCFALEILTDELCTARTTQSSYSFVLGCSLIILCFITSILWLSLQEKQRKFAQH